MKNSEDIGEVVFNMVDKNLLGSSEEDNIDDFKNGFDFNKEFSKPFQPDGNKTIEIEPIDL